MMAMTTCDSQARQCCYVTHDIVMSGFDVVMFVGVAVTRQRYGTIAGDARSAALMMIVTYSARARQYTPREERHMRERGFVGITCRY